MPPCPISKILTQTAVLLEAPYLIDAQGWEFFVEAVESSSGMWRGRVHICPGNSEPLMSVLSTDRRASAEHALVDAKALAKVTRVMISERIRWNDEMERERRNIGID